MMTKLAAKEAFNTHWKSVMCSPFAEPEEVMEQWEEFIQMLYHRGKITSIQAEAWSYCL